jgi:hypothetical protein
MMVRFSSPVPFVSNSDHLFVFFTAVFEVNLFVIVGGDPYRPD